MLILIDNYDSFSYNLYQMLGEMEPDIQVYRSDALTVEQLLGKKPSRIILSPGPGHPSRAGICEDLIRTLAVQERRIPLLGVCLGHQAICEAFGGRIVSARRLMHGKQSRITLEPDSPLFHGMEARCLAGRYHSLAVEPDTLPDCLRVTARTDDGEIMAAEHTKLPIYGMQFHPESILTPEGRKMLENFLNL